MPSNSPYNQTQYSAGQPVPQGQGNRYIPPTFNYRPNPSSPYSQMDWNNVQNYNLPQQGNNPFTQEYMGGLRTTLGGFPQRYPRQQPTMPQFGGQGGRGGRGGFNPMQMMMEMYRGMSPGQMFGGQRGGGGRDYRTGVESAYDYPGFGTRPGRGGGGGSYDDYVNNFRPEGTPPGMYRDMSIQPGRDIPFSREEWEQSQQQGGAGRDPYEGYLDYREQYPYGTDPGFNVDGPRPNGPAMSREEYTQWLRDTESGRYDSMYPDPYTGQRGGGYQDIIARFYEQMMARDSANKPVGNSWVASGEGQVKPSSGPYDKIGYRG